MVFELEEARSASEERAALDHFLGLGLLWLCRTGFSCQQGGMTVARLAGAQKVRALVTIEWPAATLQAWPLAGQPAAAARRRRQGAAAAACWALKA